MNSKLKSLIKFILSFSVGIGILWLISRKLDFQEQLTFLVNTDFSWIVLSLVIAVASHWSRAARWNTLLKPLGYNPKITTTFYAVMVGYLFNLALPRMGEVTRCAVLSKQEDIPLNKVISTVIVERGFDLLCLIILTLFTIFIQRQLLYDYVAGLFMKNLVSPLYQSLTQNVTIIAVVIAFLLLVSIGIFAIIKKIKSGDSKWNRYLERIKEILLGFRSGLVSILKMKNKRVFFLHTFFIWLGYYLMVYVCFFSMPSVSVLEWLDGLTVLSLGSFGIVFPTPGGVGAYQLIIQSILTQLYQIADEPANVFANVVWSSQTLMVIVVGSMAYLRLTILRKRVKGNGKG